MSLIEVAVNHFNNKEVRQIEVPEWDTTLYSKNLSLADKAKWMKLADDDNWNYLVYAVIFGITDAQGEPVFDIGDKASLRGSVDPDIVSKIASFVLNVEAESEEDREKN